MNIVKKSIDSAKKLKWYDISIIKICLISFTLMLAGLIPVLTQRVSRELYLIIFVITYIYTLFIMFNQKKKKQNIIQRGINAVKGFTINDRIIFKICIISFTLMLAGLIPELLNVKWRIYGIVFLISYLYILHTMLCVKEK